MTEDKRYQAIIDDLWPKLKRETPLSQIPVPKVGEVTPSSAEEGEQGEAVDWR